MKISDGIFSALQMEFPPCSSLEAVEITEQLLFALCGLTEFIRPVTAAERAVGLGNGHPAAFVRQNTTAVSFASTGLTPAPTRKTHP